MPATTMTMNAIKRMRRNFRINISYENDDDDEKR
jgi:hypothetical protein